MENITLSEIDEALIRLKGRTENRISEINNQLRAIRNEIADQIAKGELYRFREVVKGTHGYEFDKEQAFAEAKKLKTDNELTISKLEIEKKNLEFDLESLNEMLESIKKK
jgi:tRNA(Ile)-lysidine synthase TilS/MesJ